MNGESLVDWAADSEYEVLKTNDPTGEKLTRWL